MEVDDTYEMVKGRSLSEMIYPKIPIIDPKTKKRQDGRTHDQIRKIALQSGIRTEATGSAFIEMGKTKVICVVNGPKDLPRKIEFSNCGLINVEIQMMGGKVPEKNINMIQEALEAVIQLEKCPKTLIEIFFTVVEDDGSLVAACITAAGLALLEGGIPIFDVPIGASLLFIGKDLYLDPLKSEVDNLDLTDDGRNEVGGGIVTFAYLPNRDQICLLTFEGKTDPSLLSTTIDSLKNVTEKIYTLLREHSFEAIKAQIAKQSNS